MAESWKTKAESVLETLGVNAEQIQFLLNAAWENNKQVDYILLPQPQLTLFGHPVKFGGVKSPSVVYGFNPDLPRPIRDLWVVMNGNGGYISWTDEESAKLYASKTGLEFVHFQEIMGNK